MPSTEVDDRLMRLVLRHERLAGRPMAYCIGPSGRLVAARGPRPRWLPLEVLVVALVMLVAAKGLALAALGGEGYGAALATLGEGAPARAAAWALGPDPATRALAWGIEALAR